MTRREGLRSQGLYRPQFEHDACGIGMLADVKGRPSHKLVTDAVDVLGRLTHRGGAGSEPDTGDGAGILIQLPHRFFARVMAQAGVRLPGAGNYAVAMVFASPNADTAAASLAAFGRVLADEGLDVLGTRAVAVNRAACGKTAAAVCPGIFQVFIARPKGDGPDAFERRLYVASRVATRAIRYAQHGADRYFYLVSISSRTVVYKGMLLPSQLPAFYLDLLDEELTSAIALVHSRFSTNTFPSWERAHPMRHIIHNGEINTIRGNAKWVLARQSAMQSPLFGEALSRCMPVIDEDGSDSALLDDYLRLLVNSGYSLPHAMLMAIPEPFGEDREMDDALRAFYQYHNCLFGPWDGPAAVAFTDGEVCGAMLDRNGLRPARYTLTTDGLLVLASETGVLPIPEEKVVEKQRLLPGQMLLVDTATGRVLRDGEIKRQLAAQKPYGQWLAEGLRWLDGLPAPEEDAPENPVPLLQREKLFGFTYEDKALTLRGMAEEGEDPVGSMGTDAPLAVLSRRPQLLYNYFQQLFAQVTNPPIDAIREKAVTSAAVLLGAGGNLLEPGPENCRMIAHPTPVLLPDEVAKLPAVTLSMVFEAGLHPRKAALKRALDSLFAKADAAVAAGCGLIVLTDEGVGETLAPIPALLAVSGLHQHLVRHNTRARVSLVAKAGDCFETHHLAALVGFGADAVCPWMAFEMLDDMAGDGAFSVDAPTARQNYAHAMTSGIVKIMSKMGISTVRSYHGAQVFEALGVGEKVVDRYFTGTVTRIGGLELPQIQAEAEARHEEAFGADAGAPLGPGGNYKWRADGEYHLFNPENIFYLQQSCRGGDYSLFKKYTACVNDRTKQLKNIRGLLHITEADKPIPLDAVEDERSIVKRFKTGAMSYGSISKEAHECMAVAMNRLGARSNTGEGGEDSDRFVPDENGESRCSAIKQVASGRFGVTLEYLNSAREIQIKMAQGAKPGEGGHLPGGKVYPWIAKARHSTPGVELISPPPHHDIYSIEDLAQLIHDLKSANPAARVSVKLVSEAGVGTVAVGVAKGLADVIVVSGYDGGTGAAPRTSIRHAGLPWELGVAEAHQTLLMNGLRSRVVLETDGKLLTGRDIVIAALLGAEEFAFATAPLVVMGCDMMRVCNLDTCPVGIATQNPDLRARFAAKPEHVENLMLFLAREVREWMARIGVRRFEELIGHVELLRQVRTDFTDKAALVDLSGLLFQPKVVDRAGERFFTQPQNHNLEKTLDTAVLLPLCQSAVQQGAQVRCHLPITNQNRTVGCTLSHQVVRQNGPGGLADGAIRLHFTGSAGQSFGAFLAPGVELALCGDANDYLGKGLCGGRVIVAPPEGAPYPPGQNVAVGNVAFFGATSGEGYIRGKAGERFCVRNSGAMVVAEGAGENGCEYMTGGVAVLLGPVGRNFAAGMSGGVAYLYDPDGHALAQCGGAHLALSPAGRQDAEALRALLQRHAEYTGSTRAQRILQDFDAQLGRFLRVIPKEYQRVLRQMEKEEPHGKANRIFGVRAGRSPAPAASGAHQGL